MSRTFIYSFIAFSLFIYSIIFLIDIYDESLKHIKLKKNDVILDIGANDGTLLKYYKQGGYKTIGCEPANNLKKEFERFKKK